MPKSVLFLATLLSFLPFASAQGDINSPEFNWNSKPAVVFQDRIVADSLALWEERVYLHLDKDKADVGEAIFFKAYVYNGPTQKRFSPSGVLRLELRDAENALVSMQYHSVEAGSGEGVLRLPEKLDDGTYEIVAYTRWMKNYGEGQFFRKNIQIGDSEPSANTEMSQKKRPVIVVYPEGGRLLEGIPNRLVLASRSAEGTSGSVDGTILDENGTAVANVQPYSNGFGMAIIQPEAGKSYTFKTKEGEATALPEILKEGYALRVNTLSSEKIRIEVRATESLKHRPVVLEGKKDGQSYFIHMLEFEDGSSALDIAKAALPKGLMTFYLTGTDEVAWAERPVWIDSKEALNIEARPLNDTRSKDGQMTLRIKVTDEQGKPVQTELSAAVNRQSAISPLGIDQYLKPITSDVQISDERSLRFVEDLKAQSLSTGTSAREVPSEIRFPVERNLELHGTVYDLDNRLLTNTKIQMMASSDSDLVIRELETDATGVLHIENINVTGETRFIFRTQGEEQSQRLVKLRPNNETFNPKGPAVKAEPVVKEEIVESQIYKKEQRNKEYVETTPPVPFDSTGVIQLKEVTVADLRKREQEMVPSLYGIKPNPFDVAYQDPEKPLPIEQLIQKIPGMQFRPTAEGIPAIYHTRRGGGSVLWVVDGQIIRTRGTEFDGNRAVTVDDPYLSPLTFLTPQDILRIEFVIDAGNTSLWGVQGATGVMVIYTRSGNFLDYVNRKEGGLNFKGYEPALDFDTYLTERQKDRKLRKIPPSTLYWNPSLRTDKNGEAVIRFNSPEEFEKLQLSIETLTPDGRLGVLRQTF
jgi:hypothetical protein